MRAGDVRKAWTELPISDTKSIFGTGRTLVLAPHPDDESIGCGGMIAELCGAGRPPRVAVLTDGTGSHPGSNTISSSALRRIREHEAREALRLLGFAAPNAPIFMRLRDTAAPHRGALFEVAVSRLRALCTDCDTICAPWSEDPHSDHLAAHLMAAAVAKYAAIRHISYPVWGWTLPDEKHLPERPVRGWRLDISAYMAQKQSAVQAHRSQHGMVVKDDSDGFVLTPALLEITRRPYEVYLES
jgi:LmbE family N-acetylglucosaminyl deacetylase